MIKTINLWVILAFLASFSLLNSCDGNGKEDEAKGKSIDYQEEEVEKPKDGIFPGLDTETELRIRQDFMVYANMKPERGFTVGHVWIQGYFGTYNGSVPLMITGIGIHYVQWTTAVIVAGYRFGFPSAQQILVWKSGDNDENGHFYKLDEAYDSGFLTDEDIKCTYDLYQYYTPRPHDYN